MQQLDELENESDESTAPAKPEKRSRQQQSVKWLILLLAAAGGLWMTEYINRRTESPPQLPVKNERIIDPSSEEEAVTTQDVVTATRIGEFELNMRVADIKRTANFEYRVRRFPDTPPCIEVTRVQGTKRERLICFITANMEQFGYEERRNESVLNLPDDDRLTFILTANRRYRMPENLGVGSTIAEAERLLGAATLYYSPDGEYATFENQPADMSFWVTGKKDVSGAAAVAAEDAAAEKKAGIYAESKFLDDTGFQVTHRYHPDSVIYLISINTKGE